MQFEIEEHARLVPSPDLSISNTRIAHWKPIRCSVMHTIWLSAWLNATRFTAVGNSHTYRHFPLCTSHSINVLSAAPDTINRDSAAQIMSNSHEENIGGEL